MTQTATPGKVKRICLGLNLGQIKLSVVFGKCIIFDKGPDQSEQYDYIIIPQSFVILKLLLTIVIILRHILEETDLPFLEYSLFFFLDGCSSLFIQVHHIEIEKPSFSKSCM